MWPLEHNAYVPYWFDDHKMSIVQTYGAKRHYRINVFIYCSAPYMIGHTFAISSLMLTTVGFLILLFGGLVLKTISNWQCTPACNQTRGDTCSDMRDAQEFCTKLRLTLTLWSLGRLTLSNVHIDNEKTYVLTCLRTYGWFKGEII